MIKDINPSLDTAISHDVAELIDSHYNLSFSYAQTLAKLLLISSLSSILNGVKGLDELLAQCWYIKPTHETGAISRTSRK